MTAQIYERLLYEDKPYNMAATPLDAYFDQQGVTPPFREVNTALWRRYVGAWEIRDGRLWFVDISATLEDGSPATPESIFSGQAAPIFADWYTGVLRVPRGKQVKYIHMGFGSRYEEDLLLHIDKGVLISSEIQRNKL